MSGRPYTAPAALYAAFDRFPSAKGAAVHIDRMARTLFEAMGGGLLCVLGDETLPVYQRDGLVAIRRYHRRLPNYLLRALDYSAWLTSVLDEQDTLPRLCHFRDPWSGAPIVTRPGRRYQTVYEINGLPSIELPEAYPDLTAPTLAKIRATEMACWNAADRIITPSATVRDNLVALGASGERVVVIPNGADVPDETPPRPAGAPDRYLLYFGALQRWQGLEMALRALALLGDLADLALVVCVSTHPRQARPYQTLAERLGVTGRVHWRYALPEAELAPWRAHATLALAPLAECPRNLEQGCCPLKILEAMAAGVPVVASDLPAVREIVTHGRDGWLVRPDRPADLARAVRLLLEYPERRAALGQAARARIAAGLTWAHATARLREVYVELMDENRLR